MEFYRVKIEELTPGVLFYTLQKRKLFRRWKSMGRFDSESAALKTAKKDFIHKPVKYKTIKQYSRPSPP